MHGNVKAHSIRTARWLKGCFIPSCLDVWTERLAGGRLAQREGGGQGSGPRLAGRREEEGGRHRGLGRSPLPLPGAEVPSNLQGKAAGVA